MKSQTKDENNKKVSVELSTIQHSNSDTPNSIHSQPSNNNFISDPSEQQSPEQKNNKKTSSCKIPLCLTMRAMESEAMVSIPR